MEPIPGSYRLLRLVESESMRQIINLPTTQGYVNASTRCFFAKKVRCGLEFRNLPHTSVLRARKCGEKPRSADQTPVLRFHDLRFYW